VKGQTRGTNFSTIAAQNFHAPRKARRCLAKLEESEISARAQFKRQDFICGLSIRLETSTRLHFKRASAYASVRLNSMESD
jgi:hypothetical protein